MIKSLLLENPWWETGAVPDVLNPPCRRFAFDPLAEVLKDDRITALIGPRRVGKSTLLYQLIHHLIKTEGVSPKRICYLSMENPLLNFEDAFDCYLSDILAKTIRNLDERIYLFIDEIHFWPEWNRRLKRFVDLKLPAKIIVSGSSATHLLAKSTETLAGRIQETYLYPLDFGEYVLFMDRELFDRLSWLRRMDVFSPEGQAEMAGRRGELMPFQDRMFVLFQAFKRKGGFLPYLHLDFPEYHRYLRSDIIEKTIYKDLTLIHTVRSPLAIEKLLSYISLHTAERFNVQNLSRDLGISIPSLERYLSYLETSMFIASAKNILPSGRPALKSYMKVYLADLSIRRVLARGVEDEGLEVETVLFNAIYRKAALRGWRVYYWQRQQEEVDMIIQTGESCFPVEVKFRKEIKNADVRTLKKCMAQFGASDGYVITADILKTEAEQGRTLHFIPACMIW